MSAVESIAYLNTTHYHYYKIDDSSIGARQPLVLLNPLVPLVMNGQFNFRQANLGTCASSSSDERGWSTMACCVGLRSMEVPL